MALTTAEGHDALELEQDGLLYALDRAPLGGKRVVVSVRVLGSDGPAFTDAAPLLAFKGREALATTIAAHFGRDPGQILGHLALLLDQVERAQVAQTRPTTVELTPERRAAADALLLVPDILDQAASALDALGYVGEEATKRLAYLVATSRLLDRPLSAILMAPPGAGKSDLLDKLTLLLPAEAVEFLSRVTPSALYYAGPDALRRKVVVVDEQAGASDADYAIRTLQTKGLLRLAVSVGGRTERFEARGSPLSPLTRSAGKTRSGSSSRSPS